MAFFSGCGLIVVSFAAIDLIAGGFAGGVALVVLSFLHDRGGDAE